MRRPWHLTATGPGRLLFEPGEGLDPAAAASCTEEIVRALRAHAAHTLYYDVKDVAVIDAPYWRLLVAVDRGCRLFGARLVVVHMRPETAYALAGQLRGAVPFACAQGLEEELSKRPPAVPARARRGVAGVLD